MVLYIPTFPKTYVSTVTAISNMINAKIIDIIVLIIIKLNFVESIFSFIIAFDITPPVVADAI